MNFLKFQIKNSVESSFLNAFPDLQEKFYSFQQAPFQNLKFQIEKLNFFVEFSVLFKTFAF